MFAGWPIDFKSGCLRSGSHETATILVFHNVELRGTLPVESEGRLTYRIKSAVEKFERTADESDLTLAVTFASLLAAIGGWGLWQHGGRQGRLEELPRARPRGLGNTLPHAGPLANSRVAVKGQRSRV